MSDSLPTLSHTLLPASTSATTAAADIHSTNNNDTNTNTSASANSTIDRTVLDLLILSVMSHWTTIGALSGAAAVGLGAFGSHGLRSYITQDEKLISIWQTSSYYHLVHSLALTVTPLIVMPYKQYIQRVATSPAPALISARLFVSGMLLFNGSLYLLVLTNQRKLGMVTPIGGTLLLAGWIALALKK